MLGVHLEFFRAESDSGGFRRWFFKKGNCCRRYSNLFGFSIKKHKGGSYCSILGKSYSLLMSLLLLHYLVYNRGREYRFVFNCALLH